MHLERRRLGDELGFGGVRPETIELVASLIKRSLPTARGGSSPIVYYNEAWTVFANPDRFGLSVVPPSVDWISLDMYPTHARSVTTVKKLFDTEVFPRMRSGQFALYVPPGYDVNAAGGTCTDGKFHCSAKSWCGAVNCSAGMAAWAADTLANHV